jgi:hypothetical protein
LVWLFSCPFSNYLTQLVTISDLPCFYFTQLVYSWGLSLLYEWIIILKRVNKGYMPKSFYTTYASPYFGIHVVMIDLFELWWLIIDYIWFWHFILFMTLTIVGKNLRYALGAPLDFIPLVIIKMLWIYFWSCWLIWLYLLYIYKMFEISHAHVCKANYMSNCLSSFPNVPYLCKYVLPYIYVLIFACYV